MNDITNVPAMSRENAAGLKMGGGHLISITTAAEAADFARMMATADIALPKHLRGRPGVCLAVVIQAVQWNADPFQVANKSYVVNDRLAYEAQLYAALLLSSGLVKGRPRYSYDGETGSTRRCTVTLQLVEGGDPVVYTSPQVGKITPKNSPLWKTDEDQQLAYYSIRACGRRDFPDVLLGFLSTDEAASMPADPPAHAQSTPVRPSTVDKLDALAGQTGPAEIVEEAEVVDPDTGEVTTAAPPATGAKEQPAADTEKPKGTRARKPAPKADPTVEAQPSRQEQVAAAVNQPLVQAALDAFPGAEVTDVRLNEATSRGSSEPPPAADAIDDDPFDDFSDDDEAAGSAVDPEEERILTRLGEMDHVPSWIDDVVHGRQFLAGFDAAEQGRPLTTMPVEFRSAERQSEGKAWVAGHDAVTGSSPAERAARREQRAKAAAGK